MILIQVTDASGCADTQEVHQAEVAVLLRLVMNKLVEVAANYVQGVLRKEEWMSITRMPTAHPIPWLEQLQFPILFEPERRPVQEDVLRVVAGAAHPILMA